MEHGNGSGSVERPDTLMARHGSPTDGQRLPGGLADALLVAALVTAATNGTEHRVGGLGGYGNAGLRDIGAITGRLSVEYCIVVHVRGLLVAVYFVAAELMHRNGGVPRGTGKGKVRLVAHVRVGNT